MRSKDIKNMRFEVGKFLHDYYKKFGEEKYDKFLTKLSLSMMKEYGEPFSSDNLRIMEAEYVMLSSKISPSNKETKDEENVKQ